MKALSLTDLPLQNKKVLMRVDFNVPLDKDGNIADDTRIVASLPSIQYVLDQGASLVLMSHLGRPILPASSEKRSSFSLKPCASRLSLLLGKEVMMASDCVGESAKKIVEGLKPGQIVLLENLRFDPEEEKPSNHSKFVKTLSSFGNYYVNEAFGSSHRPHASVVEVPKCFQGKAAAGFLLEKEVKFLDEAMTHPTRPFCALIGGAKISTKWGVIEALLNKADLLLIGGGMAYTFLKAQGFAIGDSLVEEAFIPKAKSLLADCKNKRARLILPVDIVVCDKIARNSACKIISVKEGIAEGFKGVDIGPSTIDLFAGAIKTAKTLFWNGPMGVFEIPPFEKGTFAIGHLLATLPNLKTIIGGGDSVAAIEACGVADKMTYLSTGGGASLEYIEHGTLPGIAILE